MVYLAAQDAGETVTPTGGNRWYILVVADVALAALGVAAYLVPEELAAGEGRSG